MTTTDLLAALTAQEARLQAVTAFLCQRRDSSAAAYNATYDRYYTGAVDACDDALAALTHTATPERGASPDAAGAEQEAGG